MNAKSSKLSYETAIAELDQIVLQMEAGQLPLDQSLAQYKRGAELIKFCQQSLGDAEQQISLLNDQGQLDAFEQLEE